MNVLFVTSELAPWVKTGGLGDVAAALPPALRKAGVDVSILLPYYPEVRKAFPVTVAPAIMSFGHFGAGFEPSTLRTATSPTGVPLLLLDCPAYFDRPGNPYLGPDGADWSDNPLRFGLLSRIAAWLGSTDNTLSWQPDVVHCNDWQSGLAPAYLKLLPKARAASVITVHNLAFQGLCSAERLHPLGLPERAWAMDGVEYYGHLSFLKGALQFADAITTVSPTYAREIQTDAEGMGMSGLLRHRGQDLYGILNGIDLDAWNPATDTHLPATYTAATLDTKLRNKVALQHELGLAARDDIPLLGVVSRLTHQKGLDLLAALHQPLAELPVQLAILGSGDRALEAEFQRLAVLYPGQFAVRIGFDEGLAHRIEAGADAFLMPSRFEPCGLNQMYSLRYGTPPVVRATGGLADTVTDSVTGFVFADASAEALLAAIRRAVDTWYEPELWRNMQVAGMACDVGWAEPAGQYLALYEQLRA